VSEVEGAERWLSGCERRVGFNATAKPEPVIFPTKALAEVWAAIVQGPLSVAPPNPIVRLASNASRGALSGSPLPHTCSMRLAATQPDEGTLRPLYGPKPWRHRHTRGSHTPAA
jgi:hypothetical protein